MIGLKKQQKRVSQPSFAMVFALFLVISIAAEGMYDQVKLIIYIVSRRITPFTLFIAFMLYF